MRDFRNLDIQTPSVQTTHDAGTGTQHVVKISESRVRYKSANLYIRLLHQVPECFYQSFYKNKDIVCRALAILPIKTVSNATEGVG